MRTTSVALLFAIHLCAVAPSFAQQTQNPPPPAQAPATAPQDQQSPQKSQTTIPVTVNLVDVLLTVLDRRNKLVPNLEKQDFKVLDDNV
ncbi:MAG: hypothetical protein WB607_22930, partial [Candidatus Acidiferrum sp.]